jgi:hypothetical protein
MKSGNLIFLEPSGHSRPVTGLLYLYLDMLKGDHYKKLSAHGRIILMWIFK